MSDLRTAQPQLVEVNKTSRRMERTSPTTVNNWASCTSCFWSASIGHHDDAIGMNSVNSPLVTWAECSLLVYLTNLFPWKILHNHSDLKKKWTLSGDFFLKFDVSINVLMRYSSPCILKVLTEVLSVLPHRSIIHLQACPQSCSIPLMHIYSHFSCVQKSQLRRFTSFASGYHPFHIASIFI